MTMFQRRSRSRPSGDGYTQLRQVIKSIVEEEIAEGFVGHEYATAIDEKTIELDRDGYRIYSEEDDFVVLEGVQYNPGDRLIVATVGGPRGRIVVLGRWQPSTNLIPIINHGEIYISTPAETVISNTSSFFLVNGTYTTSVVSSDFTVSDGRITYVGIPKRMFHVFSSWSFSVGASNQNVEVALRKNGVFVQASVIARKLAASGDVGSSALHSIVTLEEGDIIDVSIRNLTMTNNVTFSYLNLGIIGMPSDMKFINIP